MLTLRYKLVFFDTAKVKRHIDWAQRRAMIRAGGFLRQTARRSIRRRKGTSRPGSPPRSHAGQLRDLLFFSYDAELESLVVGPVRFRKGNAPHLLEFGGKIKRTDRRTGARKQARYRPRPFMGPALEKTAPLLPGFWRSSVKG